MRSVIDLIPQMNLAMKNFLGYIIAGLIPLRQLRRKVREKFLPKDIVSQSLIGHPSCLTNIVEQCSEEQQPCSTPIIEEKYLCCRGLFSYLNFEDDCLRPLCCNFSAFSPKYPYKGEALSRDIVLKYLNCINDTLAREPEKCGKCAMAYYASKPQEVSLRDFRLKEVCINPHRLWCNIKCIYCGYASEAAISRRVKPYSVREPIEFLINAGMLGTDCIFRWGGGESTILPEFDDLARLLCDKGYTQRMFTNGTIFSEAWAYVLSKDERTYFNISVDSGTVETYQRVHGVDRFDKVWENIKKYLTSAKNRGSFAAKYIVMACNREHSELEMFINKCLDAGVLSIEYSVDHKEVSTGLSEETLAAVAYLKAFALKHHLKCINQSFQNKSVNDIIDGYPLPKIQ